MKKFETLPAEKLRFPDSILLLVEGEYQDLDVYKVEEAGPRVILHVRSCGSYDSHLRKVSIPRYHSVRLLDD